MAEHDPTNTQAQEREAKSLERKAALDAAVEADDVKWLMGHKQGRRIAYRLLAKAGVWRSSFNTNAAVTAFNEGRRDAGLDFLAGIMEHCPDQYLVMLKEHKTK